ncbi:MAG: amino acid adenylation domain-containing protein, partial [Sediminibacterium sp.]
MIIGILGILKAGAAYVPLDSGYPMERIGFMLEDTDAEIVISSKATRSKLPASKDFEVIEIDTDWSMISEQPVTNLQTPVAPDHLAYVIYTSGSMGKPKGVMIEHRGVTSLVKDVDYVFLNASDILLSTGSFSFDATTFEYWGMLLNGGQLVLCTENRLLESALLKEEINNKQVNIMWLTSSWFNQLVETDITVFERLKTILVGGEKLSEQHIKKLRQVYPSIEIINGYGPTENTTFSLTYKIKDAALERSIPIGRPLNNRTAYILNDKLEIVPLGVAGEICVGGAGLARGYLNRPELTAQKFVANPFNDEEGSRLYRTGDLGSFQPGGNIEYLGRIDDQVKIRGYRIELGEIENVLLQSGMVKQAVVLAKEDTRLHKRLVGYVVPNEGFDRKAAATYLRARLPEYMVPAIWVEVESMPLTANGKTDRKALPDPDITEQVTVNYVAPQNETQAGLAAIWKDLLNLEKVGIEDNFFELGGDSIIAIQLISRVRRLGYSLQPKDIFIQQTIANIAQVIIGRAEAVSFAEQGYLKGTAGLLPIQQWYFEKEPSAVSHFNQSVLLKISKQITAHILQQAIDQLVTHHDALRFVYTKKNGLWQQEYGSGKPEIVIEDLGSIPVHLLDTYINEQAEVHQRSLNIEAGDIFRTVWMQTPFEEEHNFLFIVIHHLAVDGVSWRILVEDLQQLLDQLLNGRTPGLGNKTTSYREWYKTLEKYGKRKSLLSQKTYWEQAIENYEPLLDNDTDDVVKVKDLDNYLVELDADQTRNLLQQVPHVYHTEINDILLTVLTQTICKWIGRDSVVIGIEGHGREHIEDTADISRTIGWFTSLYPVSLSIAGASEATYLVKTIKEQLRQVPGKGLSYGVLKYINKEISLQGKDPWDIVFNYLGQLDNVTSEGKLLKVAGLAAGASVSEEQVAEKLVLDCHVQDGRMVIKWSFSKKHFAEKTIQKLADDYAANLVSLIEHCLRQDKRANTHTPSDYGLGGVVKYKELDRFLDESFNGVKRHESIDGLYPLSGLQQGMLFHGLYDGEAGAYINQLTCNLAGVNIELVIKSWNEILKRHTILRSAFYHDAFSVPVQYVYKEVGMPVTILDYRGMNEKDRSLAIKEYQEDDRRKGFDFRSAPLMRLALIRSAEDHWLMIWTSHHILFDGWSLPVLIENFLSTYDSLLAGKETNDTAVDRFEDYIRFIENSDKELQETYWRNYLKEVEQGSLLPFIETTAVRTKGAGIYNSTLFNLDAASTETLHQYAQVHHLTINTVMQGVWATLLHRYTNNENIVYGVIESGRPDQLDKVEQRVGMYINTIPFHTRIKSEKPIVEWLQEIQSQQAESRQYQHTSLTSIQKWTGLQGDLFDSLLVFENYPISKVLKENKWSLQLDNIQLHEQTNYPLTIVITNTEQLSIQFTYNADLLPAVYVKLMQDHFKQALLQFISNENRLNDVKIITEAEKQQLVYGFNDTTATYPTNKSIVDLVEEQVEKYPSNIAVVYENEELTYKQLNERANQLAHDLQKRGVTADTLVPICLERNIEMIIGILAILKAGGAYVPIDPDYPAERIQYMLEDTAATVMLASSETAAAIKMISNVDVILVDDKDAFSDESTANLHINILPEQLAYVIYTSGSTGRPKGVL